MFSADTEDDMVECPYNKAHRLLRKRLQSHLLKCRVNYPNVELQKCPFNQLHLIPEPEFVHHVTNCSDRKLITQYKYTSDTVIKEEEERVKQEPIECEENWDDTDVVDYDPQKYIETANVLRRPDGIQPAQRKAFIKKERKRLGDYNSDEEEQKKKILVFKKEEPVYDDGYTRRAGSPTFSSYSGSTRRSYRSRSRERVRNYEDYRELLPPVRRPSPPPLYHRRPSPPPLDNKSGHVYDLDDDPYYNGGSSSSNRDNDVVVSSSSSAKRYRSDELPPPPPSFYYPPVVPPIPSYLIGRGSYRGRSYIASPPIRGRYMPFYDY